MQALTLTPAQRKALRAQAHHLDPVVSIGADGLTAGVLKEADAALAAHGLIKLRMFSDQRDQREAALRELAERLGAAAVQHIGKLLVLWRPRPAVAKAAAPAGAAPRVVRILKFPKSGHPRPQIQKVTVYGNQRVTAGGSIKRAKARPVSRKKQALD
ncbi:MAG: YhbY family RNA-binding protein [Burkholderiales bacterium]|nr:YhbY family RNA-binding protein [Burkholderiales bacterium]